MADVSMKDFLTQYFMQRIFNEMPEEQFARFTDFLKADDLTSNMKKWKEKKLVIKTPVLDAAGNPVHDSHGNPKTIWEKNREYPGTPGHDVQMTDDEWKKLFKEFRNAFRAMDADRDNINDDQDKALKFLDENFGRGKLFSHAEPTPEEKTEIQNVLKPLLQDNSQINWPIELTTQNWRLFESKEDATKFISDIRTDKYLHDPKLQKKLLEVVEFIRYYGENWNIKEELFPNLAGKSELGGDAIDATQLAGFKSNYQILLNALTDEKVRGTFQNYGSKIIKPFDAAKGKLGYDSPDSKDYLPPKRDDKLTPFQQASKWIGDTWADRMGKYTKLRGGQIFFSAQAQDIIKALDKTDFKPTDGLDKFVSKMGDISKNLISPKTREHMKWFKETIEKLQSDKQMKKIFAGALKNGEQMKELIAELSIQAIQDGKGEAAKTAMEVLKNIQYGYATSNTYNAFKSQDFTFLSDGNLSWNKNEGIKFITTAMDKTFNFALKATGLAITMGINAYKRSGKKFKGKETKRITKVHEAYTQKRNQNRADAKQNFDFMQDADKQLKEQYDTDLRDLDHKDGINEHTIERKETWLTGLQGIAGRRKTDLENAKNAQSTAQESVDAAQQGFDVAKQNYDYVNDVITSHHDKEAQLAKLKKDLKNLQTQMRRISKKPTPLAAADNARLNALANKELELKDKIKQQKLQIQDNRQAYNDAQSQIGGLNTTLNDAQNALNNANTDLQTAETATQNAQQRYSDAQDQANDLEEKINKFKTATQNLQEAQERMDKRQEEWDQWDDKHQDEFVELMAHWDFLNSGRKRTGENVFSQVMHKILPVSRKKRQAKYNAKKQGLQQAFLANYQQLNRD